MSTLTLVLLGLFVLVAAFIAYVAARPSDFRIERSQRIRASADAVFARIDDLRQFSTWNPFPARTSSIRIKAAASARRTNGTARARPARAA